MRVLIALLCVLVLAASCGGTDGKNDDAVPEVVADLADAADLAADAPGLEDVPADVPVDVPGDADVADVAADSAVDAFEEVVEPPQATLAGWDEVLAAADPALLADFLAAYDGPFCEGTTCLFVTRVTGADSVALRGELNEWEQTPMEPLSFADDFSYFLWEEAAFDGRMAYKLFADDAWLMDPLNRYFSFSDVALNSALYADGESRLALVPDLYSPQLDNTRNLYVYVPAAAFADPTARFPVMYMQDGFNLFDNPMAPYGSWHVDATVDELAAAGAIEPPIVVGIDTDDRTNEYLYADILLDGGDEYIIVEPKLDPYAEFLVDDIKPLIDAQFPTKPGRADTIMAGSSFGGISSLYIAWSHADVFGKVASFSGSFWIGESNGTGTHPAMRDLVAATTPSANQLALQIYLDSGSAPEGDPTPEPYSFDARCYTDWTRNQFIEMGWANRAEYDTDGMLATPPEDLPAATLPADVPTLFWAPEPPEQYGSWDNYLHPEASLLHLVGEGHLHNEAAWEQRLPAALRFLLPPL